MSLYETIQSDMYEAMKGSDKFKTSTLRVALARLKDKKIESINFKNVSNFPKNSSIEIKKLKKILKKNFIKKIIF